jgi:hypothetical protein
VEFSLFSFFEGSHINTVILGKGNPGFLSFSDDENVSGSGGESVAVAVFDVDDGEGAHVLFDVGDGSDSSDVVTGSDEANVSSFEFNEIFNFIGF